MQDAVENDSLYRVRAILHWLALACVLLVLAWSPFPLGGAIHWGAGLQAALIAVCWVIWSLSYFGNIRDLWSCLKPVRPALFLGLLVVGWAVLQSVAVLPAGWAHPLWSMTSDVLGRKLPATISVNPWRTQAEALNLASYILFATQIFVMARRAESAAVLFHAAILIGSAYAAYGLILAVIGMGQASLFYSTRFSLSEVSGPFMLHNSFATYIGLTCLVAVAKLFADGSVLLKKHAGWRHQLRALLEHVFGRGIWLISASALCLAALIATQSRAGSIAFAAGLIVLAVGALFLLHHRRSVWTLIWAILAGLMITCAVASVAGNDLASGINALLVGGDAIRPALWTAGVRMIADSPYLGYGLGAFQDVYPMFASQYFPYVMDKAHCDYIELVTGLGLPAALVWLVMLATLALKNLRGLWHRRHNRIYSLVALASTVLVAVHSLVDFSLQLPAVAALYTVLLAVGTAQSHISVPKK